MQNLRAISANPRPVTYSITVYVTGSGVTEYTGCTKCDGKPIWSTEEDIPLLCFRDSDGKRITIFGFGSVTIKEE